MGGCLSCINDCEIEPKLPFYIVKCCSVMFEKRGIEGGLKVVVVNVTISTVAWVGMARHRLRILASRQPGKLLLIRVYSTIRSARYARGMVTIQRHASIQTGRRDGRRQAPYIARI